MKIRNIAVAMGALALVATAQNPIVQTKCTPDPAPYVHGDTVYVFTGHDEEDAQYFSMKDWQVYATTDMVNWTYLGTPMSTATFKWAKQGDNAWASQAIERNGKWYWYICAEDTTCHLHGIGVGVADNPAGPYVDPIGKPLVPGNWGFIDPSVFIDDDGQAYLFWGNNGLWYCKLNEDMISLGSDVIPVENLADEKAFGPNVMKMDYQLHKRVMKTGYEEGPWVFKCNGLYYLVYAAGGVPEHMAYSTSKSIHGPWKYRGRVMDESTSFTIHGGSIEFAGRDFMFYHTADLPNGGGFRRSSAVEEFKWNPDGTMPLIPRTRDGVKTPVRNLNPYQRVEAETMADSYGLQTDRLAGYDHYVTSINNGDWLKLRSVDFGKGASKVKVRARGGRPGSIQFRVDGKVAGEVQVAPQSYDWQEFEAPVEGLEGVHDVILLFRGPDGELFDLDSWIME